MTVKDSETRKRELREATPEENLAMRLSLGRAMGMSLKEQQELIDEFNKMKSSAEVRKP